jgi:hypothetical protein
VFQLATQRLFYDFSGDDPGGSGGREFLMNSVDAQNLSGSRDLREVTRRTRLHDGST